jgi:drug/metabolite transporter (DMT)-like permease
VGFCGNFFPAFLFTYAETGISSGFAGMLNSFTPIFTILIGFLIYKQRITSFQVVGTIIGTIGIVLLINAGKSVSLNASIFHVLAIVFATFLYGVSLTTIKNKLQHYSSVDITTLAFLMVFLPALIAFFVFGTPSVILKNEHALKGLGYISILAIFGTAMAVFLFNGIIRMSSALFASSVTYFIPVVAVIIGFFFKESFLRQ